MRLQVEYQIILPDLPDATDDDLDDYLNWCVEGGTIDITNPYYVAAPEPPVVHASTNYEELDD